ncbi:hypothetical protein ACFUIW_03730 [Streptomyces sp. NPDC057245]|uniref:hypothetical protein n=1 Tax=Streptomyces sp. NPDC057245 TaxID=3346065 RepID=UPI00362FBE5D
MIVERTNRTAAGVKQPRAETERKTSELRAGMEREDAISELQAGRDDGSPLCSLSSCTGGGPRSPARGRGPLRQVRDAAAG